MAAKGKGEVGKWLWGFFEFDIGDDTNGCGAVESGCSKFNVADSKIEWAGVLLAENYLLERKFIGDGQNLYGWARAYYGDGLEWSVVGLPAGVYLFRVRAFNIYGMSDYSSASEVVIGGGSEVPQVVGLVWDAVEGRLSWTGIDGDVIYEAEWEAV